MVIIFGLLPKFSARFCCERKVQSRKRVGVKEDEKEWKQKRMGGSEGRREGMHTEGRR